jgi:hypothetical protein
MAGNTPSQNRAIDPFSSYNSDIVNQLSRNITRNDNGLLAVSDLNVYIDSTSPLDHVVVKPGFAVISDVLIQVNADHRVNFRDSTHYVTPSGGIFDEIGYYYVVLEYNYAKSRPAPTAKLKILRPSESGHSSLGDSLLFLKAVNVVSGVGANEIDSVADIDPGNTTNRRRTVNLDISADYERPTFDAESHVAKVFYEISTNKYWFGFDDRWEEISAGVSVSINTDSTALLAGMLAYVDSNGEAQPAIAGGVDTRAEMVVLEVGTAASGNGRARLAGVIDDVLVETGQTVGQGDVVYLSVSVAGTITSSRPSGSYQVVGKAMTAGSDAVPVKVLFFPGDVIFSAVTDSIEPGDWVYDSTTGLYFADVDITRLNLTVLSAIVNCWTSGYKISPTDVALVDGGDTCRIYMPINTLTVDATITDGAGGGSATGGGGSSSHAVLSNLDYASSGHTGFAPSPHGNADHSSTFITASGVTFENLDANSDIGTGATQVAQGDHTHASLADIPTNETILFEKNTAVTGYTLLITYDDMVVYITKGTGAGGESGGVLKSGGTWTQPGHTLSISEIPAHDHSISVPPYAATTHRGSGSSNWTLAFSSPVTATGTTGGGGSHNHGSSWRPTGLNFTRQRRN